jgi:bacteriophage HK97-gp10 putative tail-component
MITILGVDTLLARFAAEIAASDAAAAAGADTLAEDVLAQARERVPVLTGTLRDSLHVETTGLVARVVTDVVYAGQVEYGGAHNPPEPYMRPAADLANTEAAALAAKAVIEGV